VKFGSQRKKQTHELQGDQPITNIIQNPEGGNAFDQLEMSPADQRYAKSQLDEPEEQTEFYREQEQDSQHEINNKLAQKKQEAEALRREMAELERKQLVSEKLYNSRPEEPLRTAPKQASRPKSSKMNRSFHEEINIDDVIAEFEELKRRKAEGIPIGGRKKKGKGEKLDKTPYDDLLNYEKPKGMYSFKTHGYSPTKRLMNMRNKALKHKLQLCAKDPGSIHPHMTDEYRITYLTSTNKLIVMKPEAEIDYDLHAQSPKKFY